MDEDAVALRFALSFDPYSRAGRRRMGADRQRGLVSGNALGLVALGWRGLGTGQLVNFARPLAGAGVGAVDEDAGQPEQAAGRHRRAVTETNGDGTADEGGEAQHEAGEQARIRPTRVPLDDQSSTFWRCSAWRSAKSGIRFAAPLPASSYPFSTSGGGSGPTKWDSVRLKTATSRRISPCNPSGFGAVSPAVAGNSAIFPLPFPKQF